MLGTTLGILHYLASSQTTAIYLIDQDIEDSSKKLLHAGCDTDAINFHGQNLLLCKAKRSPHNGKQCSHWFLEYRGVHNIDGHVRIGFQEGCRAVFATGYGGCVWE
jgi:hypothetical protein